MRISWQHVDTLNVVACDFELYHLIGAELALLNEAVTGDHDEELPLGVVPVLAFGDAGLADVDHESRESAYRDSGKADCFEGTLSRRYNHKTAVSYAVPMRS